MIEWNAPKQGGRAGSAAYIAISVSKGGVKDATGKIRKSQLVMRFGPVAVKDLRLLSGDRVIIGFDSTTKEVCFKRTTDGTGYKITGKSGASLTVQSTCEIPTMHVRMVEKSDVKIESTHVAIRCEHLFNYKNGGQF